MTFLDCVKLLLAKHREGRAWTDTGVARDVLGYLGIDETAQAPHPVGLPDPTAETEAAAVALEATAAQAVAKAKAARDAIDHERAANAEAASKASADAAAKVAEAAEAAETQRLADERLAAADLEAKRLADMAREKQEAEAQAARQQEAAAKAAEQPANPEVARMTASMEDMRRTADEARGLEPDASEAKASAGALAPYPSDSVHGTIDPAETVHDHRADVKIPGEGPQPE